LRPKIAAMSASPPPITPMSTRPPKTIVLCFDGTANEFDSENTNVVKLFGLLNKDLPDHQVCYYQASVVHSRHTSSPSLACRQASGPISLLAWSVRCGNGVPRFWMKLSHGMYRLATIWYYCCLDPGWLRYLYAHVSDGYQFLMQNYMEGDKICLFGKCSLHRLPNKVDNADGQDSRAEHTLLEVSK
jgi:hypothetical protein